MAFNLPQLLVLACFLWLSLATPTPEDPKAGKKGGGDVIERDVVIVGGGAGGTYTAIKLRDAGKTVLLIERQGRLGGHTETYVDPASGQPINLGVQSYEKTGAVEKFFARLGVPLTLVRGPPAPSSTINVDFKTGEKVTPPPTNPANTQSALAAYAKVLAQYPYLSKGYETPNPVPADLLLPFGEFAKKYNVEGVTPLAGGLAQAFDIEQETALYVLNLFNFDSTTFQQGTYVEANRDNSRLYTKATEELGADVLLNAQVVGADRKPKQVTLQVEMGGKKVTVQAKKLVLAIPPTGDNMKAFDFQNKDSRLFDQFVGRYYWSGVLSNSGLPAGTDIRNVNPRSPYGLPDLPALYAFRGGSAPSGLVTLKYSSSKQYLTEQQVKDNIVADLRRLPIDGVANAQPQFPAFVSHTPYLLTVSADAIKNGFYTELNGLQGKRNTYFTGAAWSSQNSAKIWAFTDELVPRILSEIDG